MNTFHSIRNRHFPSTPISFAVLAAFQHSWKFHPPHTHKHIYWRKAEVCRMCTARKNLEAHTKYNQVRTRAEKCHTPVQAGLVMQGIDTSPAAYQTALANKSSPIRVCLPGMPWLGLAWLPFSQFAIAFALIFHAATVVAPSVVA